jgi:DNA transposition AAA+ family ATPase
VQPKAKTGQSPLTNQDNKYMTHQDKINISQLVAEARVKFSLPQLANKIGGISGPTLSQIANQKWIDNPSLNFSDKTWNTLANFFNYATPWVFVTDDKNTRKIMRICRHAQAKSISRLIIGDPGMSKSASLKHFAKERANVYYVECASFFTKREFLATVRKSMGLPADAPSVADQIKGITARLRETTKPLLIIDEVDKLRDDIIGIIVAIWNATENGCGIVLCGSAYMEKRMDRGLRLKKQSYRELYSRIGGEFIELHDLTPDRVEAICIANGIVEPSEIRQVVNMAHNDLRRVKNEIEAIRYQNAKQQDAA